MKDRETNEYRTEDLVDINSNFYSGCKNNNKWPPRTVQRGEINVRFPWRGKCRLYICCL
jgi:hypothetical protein